MKTEANEKVIYVGVNKKNHLQANGYLAFNYLTNGLDINLFKLEKYRSKPCNVLPGAIQYVQVESSQEDFNNDDIIIKIMIDNDFHILESECINRSNYQMEDVLINEIKKQKISGIYPGAYQGYQKSINKVSEADMVLLIDQTISKVNSIEENISNNELTKEMMEKLKTELIEWQYAFDFCIAHLSRFGVEQKFNPKTNRMEETPTFVAWYKWWQDYLSEIRNNPELYSKFVNCRKTCQQLDFFKPEGDFTNCLVKEQKLLVKGAYPTKSTRFAKCEKVS